MNTIKKCGACSVDKSCPMEHLWDIQRVITEIEEKRTQELDQTPEEWMKGVRISIWKIIDADGALLPEIVQLFEEKNISMTNPWCCSKVDRLLTGMNGIDDLNKV